MTKTVHHRACHLCEAICGLTDERLRDAGSGNAILNGVPVHVEAA
ncbi:molybdopterin oxidoreductase family protein [Pseudomonas sp. S31]|nr:hypothetical protein [Pseudomonas sp. S31]MBK5000080.1 molybdopterin oxidoreductase family protein [Pseudomonas sp. S31]